MPSATAIVASSRLPVISITAIIDQVEPHARWHIIMMISAAFLLQIAGIDAQLLWSVMLPALINPPKVQQYAEEMEGYWRELLLLFPCIFVFGYLELTMH